MSDLQIILVFMFVPPTVSEIISIILNAKKATTIGELLNMFGFIEDQAMRVFFRILSFVPIFNVGVLITAVGIYIVLSILPMVRNSKSYKWFIETIWNHKL